MIVTVETEGGQTPLEIVQLKTFGPEAKPVTVVVGETELVIVPLPETKDHVPTPTVGVVPVRT